MSRRRNTSRRSSPRVRAQRAQPAPQSNASPAGGPEVRFGTASRVRRAGPEGGRVDVRLVPRPNHGQGDRSIAEVVFTVLPAASLGAVPGGRVGPVRCRGRRATRGGADPGGSQAPGLAAIARRPRPSTRRRPDLRPRPALPIGRAQRRPRGVRSSNRRRPGPARRGAMAPPTGVTSLAMGVTGPDANVTPAERPSQATGRRSEPGENFKLSRRDCHQPAEIGAFSHGRSAPAAGVRTATRSEEER
jgi:hypothetical protein